MPVKSFVRNYALTCYPFLGEQEDYFVAKLIHKYMRGDRVLDLGCGPVVPVTSIFYPDAKEVVAIDRLQANLDFVKYNAYELNDIIRRAYAYKHHYLSQKDSHPKIKLVKGDVTTRLSVGKFDSAMNMGCFGALDTAEQFQKAVDNAYYCLKDGGTLLMVNWVGGVKRPHHFNGKVHEPYVYEPSMKKAGFEIQEMHITGKVLCKETRRMGYDKIIWAISNK